MMPLEYFQTPSTIAQKHYEALRRFFVDQQNAEAVAIQFDYKISAFYSLVRDFRAHLNSNSSEDFFFKVSKKSRGFNSATPILRDVIVALRKKNFSTLEIKTLLDAQGHTVSESYIALVLKQEGFARLPRRDRNTKMTRELPHQIEAPKQVSEKILHFFLLPPGLQPGSTAVSYKPTLSTLESLKNFLKLA